MLFVFLSMFRVRFSQCSEFVSLYAKLRKLFQTIAQSIENKNYIVLFFYNGFIWFIGFSPHPPLFPFNPFNPLLISAHPNHLCQSVPSVGEHQFPQNTQNPQTFLLKYPPTDATDVHRYRSQLPCVPCIPWEPLLICLIRVKFLRTLTIYFFTTDLSD